MQQTIQELIITHNLVQLEAKLEAELIEFFISCNKMKKRHLNCARIRVQQINNKDKTLQLYIQFSLFV